jgi:hypothetical protein
MLKEVAEQSNSSNNTKKGTTEKVKATIGNTMQRQMPKVIPKAIYGNGGNITATWGRRDSIGKDGSISDVPVLKPVKKTNKKEKK